MPPDRDLSGKWLEESTGVPGARIRGIHLRLPGYGEAGPTLEIFQYRAQRQRKETATDQPGFAHIAFEVDDIETARDGVTAAGGRVVGKPAHVDIPGAGRIMFVYVTDPEGNIIELQRWSG